jgi:tetratricopeptide (TPR) repeat protein
MRLEEAQRQTIRSLELVNEHNRAIMLGIGGLFTVLVAVQSFATGVELRREGQREKLQTGRERDRDLLERRSTRQVAEVMEVVQKTLESRLTSEERAREQIETAYSMLGEVRDQIKVLERFYNDFQATIKRSRQAIEETAFHLARIPRHDFRKITNELEGFSFQFDTFQTEFAALEEEEIEFSARVPHIRGIAAHYANQPELANQNLTEVITRQPEPGEPPRDYERRVAVAHYYLGLIESNFGDFQDAIDSFERANILDLERADFLTRLVTAEAHIMLGDFDRAKDFISEVESELNRIKNKDGRLPNHQLRCQSRAALIQANMAILRREPTWREQVQQVLEPVRVEDPQYYYATNTLAQVYADQGSRADAQRLFREAYQAIQQSGDLLTVVESRSRILLLMTAGMCCKHGPADERRSEEHLDRANTLLSSLPRIGGKTCTVFSALSKCNEDSSTIQHHIELIREGNVLC